MAYRQHIDDNTPWQRVQSSAYVDAANPATRQSYLLLMVTKSSDFTLSNRFAL